MSKRREKGFFFMRSPDDFKLTFLKVVCVRSQLLIVSKKIILRGRLLSSKIEVEITVDVKKGKSTAPTYYGVNTVVGRCQLGVIVVAALIISYE